MRTTEGAGLDASLRKLQIPCVIMAAITDVFTARG